MEEFLIQATEFCQRRKDGSVERVNRELLESFRNFAPRKGSDIVEITISSTVDGKETSITLTSEDRKRIDKLLEKDKP